MDRPGKPVNTPSCSGEYWFNGKSSHSTSISPHSLGRLNLRCKWGRRKSASTSSTLRPDSANAIPRFCTTVVLPSAGPGLVMRIIFWFFAVREKPEDDSYHQSGACRTEDHRGAEPGHR